MPRVYFIKKAQKDVRGSDIKKGESYYRWGSFSNVGVSRTYPTRSQLTTSDFLKGLYDLEDRFNKEQAGVSDRSTAEEFATSLESMADEVRALGEEESNKFNNMPDGLQQGPTGQLLEQHADSADELATNLDNAAQAIRDEISNAEHDEEPSLKLGASPEELSETNADLEAELKADPDEPTIEDPDDEDEETDWTEVVSEALSEVSWEVE